MSTVLDNPAEDALELRETALEAVDAGPRTGFRTDTLAESVMVLLVMAAVQRIIGFVRGVLVCRWLAPEELGQWDMAFGFLTLAAPLTVLGLPGSFGRYVEYFRQRGQLRTLVRRTAIACTILTAVSVCAISLLRTQFSLLVFGETTETSLVFSMALALVAVIAYNFLTELLNALRLARVNAVVQFFNSLAFAGFSILLLVVWQKEAASLVTAYGLSCLVLIAGMLWFLGQYWHELPADRIPTPQTETSQFWSRLLPFAAWVWVTNLLYNLFDVVDRYMIVHTARVADPLAEVGNYHSSRIVPLLLVSISTLLGTMLLPHLSHDWEEGRRKAVSDRMNLALKLLGLLLFTGSIVILLASPWLFGVAFKGKFADGMAVLPWTLTYCMWFGMATMAQMYLWCAERARLGCAALLTGLVTNVVLNLILLPRLGLLGAVLATGAANAVAARIDLSLQHLDGHEAAALRDTGIAVANQLGLWLLGSACGTSGDRAHRCFHEPSVRCRRKTTAHGRGEGI